ncbi:MULTISPECIES: hypothetical protein [Microbacterium]|nr:MULTISPECIES: hypothetical protein [Microbacterium]
MPRPYVPGATTAPPSRRTPEIGFSAAIRAPGIGETAADVTRIV